MTAKARAASAGPPGVPSIPTLGGERQRLSVLTQEENFAHLIDEYFSKLCISLVLAVLGIFSSR